MNENEMNATNGFRMDYNLDGTRATDSFARQFARATKGPPASWWSVDDQTPTKATPHSLRRMGRASSMTSHPWQNAKPELTS